MSILPIGGGTLSVSGGGGSAQSVTAYVCNPKTGASGEYAGIAFNSLAIIGGICLGAKAGGVFALFGDDDAGAQIDAAALSGTRLRTQLLTTTSIDASSTGSASISPARNSTLS